MKVMISGAGIGGLAAARGLLNSGHEVTVFEQAAALRHGGAAVTLWSNGTGVLSALGVSLDGAGAPIDVLETVTAAAGCWSASTWRSRPRTSATPLSACRGVRLLFANRPAAESLAAEGPAAEGPAAEGPAAEGDLLVAADGRGSALRDQLWGGDPGEPTGWGTWQGLSKVPSEVTAGRRSVLFVGKPGTVGLMPAGDGMLQWWFDLPWTPGTPPPASPVEMLRERFAAWAPVVLEVLGEVSDDEAGFFPHYRHKVPKTWGHGPITVIGDAAHSMPPTRAQGANQALEDAWMLAAALGDRRGSHGAGPGGNVSGAPDDTAQRLRAFERARSAKVSVVSRQGGSEDYNRYGALLSRLAPGPLVTRYYTRWLRQISNYLDASPAEAG